MRGELCRRGWGRWRAIAGRAHSMQRGEDATADWGSGHSREGCDCRLGDEARGAAHGEHDAHVRDAGGVPAQLVVEGVRALPRGSQAQGTRCARRAARRGEEVTGERGARSVRGRGCDSATAGCWGAQCACGAAHVKHVVHGRDAGGVPAQGPVELARVLPRVASTGHTDGAGRAAGRVGGRATAASAVWEVERGGKRTLNMLSMAVTREVSQSEMSWLNLCMFMKRPFMSVTPQTHQPAMAPYFSRAT